jgi:hypothetical protein
MTNFSFGTAATSVKPLFCFTAHFNRAAKRRDFPSAPATKMLELSDRTFSFKKHVSLASAQIASKGT